MSEKKLPYMIYAEVTPNPATMKFVSNHILAQNGSIYEFNSEAETKYAPFAQRLFSFPFVSKVFITQNFITLTKTDGLEWDDVMLELREYISNYLNSGNELFLEGVNEKEDENSNEASATGITDHSKANTPIEERIVEILDEYIRPAVEGDGGAIHFKSFEEGRLNVVLKGACSGCPSSSVTLKAGIKALFDRMLPEVKEVVAEEL
jgi:NFU1 iron-sulfur cluster scaffold homolog, mitochondrial